MHCCVRRKDEDKGKVRLADRCPINDQISRYGVGQVTVLIGGLRVLNANCKKSQHGVFTKRPGTSFSKGQHFVVSGRLPLWLEK